MSKPLATEELSAWTGWYEALGGAVWCADAPTDWFALEADKEAARESARDSTRARPVAGVTKAPPVAEAKVPPRSREARAAPQPETVPAPTARPTAVPMPAPFAAPDLAALAAAIAAFDGCPLKATAKNLCFYRGGAQAPLMIIGEAPGRDEDLAGKPFVGAAGQLLDKMLAAIDLDESQVHITNVVYWRPPGNRVPTPQEVRSCLPFLLRQIELVQPKMILTLGGVPAQNLLQIEMGITKLRGKWRSLAVAGKEVPLLPSLHPAYLLRTPLAKRQAWIDLQLARERLRQAASVW